MCYVTFRKTLFSEKQNKTKQQQQQQKTKQNKTKQKKTVIGLRCHKNHIYSDSIV